MVGSHEREELHSERRDEDEEQPDKPGQLFKTSPTVQDTLKVVDGQGQSLLADPHHRSQNEISTGSQTGSETGSQSWMMSTTYGQMGPLLAMTPFVISAGSPDRKHALCSALCLQSQQLSLNHLLIQLS